MMNKSTDVRKSYDMDHHSKAKLLMLNSSVEDVAYRDNFKKDKTINLNAPRTYAVSSNNPETIYSLR